MAPAHPAISDRVGAALLRTEIHTQSPADVQRLDVRPKGVREHVFVPNTSLFMMLHVFVPPEVASSGYRFP